MKKQAQKIAICVSTLIAVLVAKAGTDCHPSGHGSCAHQTTSGTELCATGAAQCDGASSGNCNTTTGKTVNSFPTQVGNSTYSGTCPEAESTTIGDLWSAHNKITTEQKNCSQVFACIWDPVLLICKKNPNDTQPWAQSGYKTSVACD